MNTYVRHFQRYIVPRYFRSLYYSLRFRCLVSLAADVQLSSFIRLGRGTNVRPFARIITTTGRIEIGQRCGLNSFVFISTATGFVRIGDDVRIGPHVTIVASSRTFDDPTKRIVDQPKVEIGITIEDDVWIGANAVVLDGVTIGRGAVIGAGAVVTKDVEPYGIALGNPARVVRRRGETRN